MMGHLFYKVLLFAFALMNPVCQASSGVRQARSYTRWKVFVLADSRAARHMAALRSPSLSEALGLARPFTRSRKLSARMRSPPVCPSSSMSTRICSTFSERTPRRKVRCLWSGSGLSSPVRPISRPLAPSRRGAYGARGTRRPHPPCPGMSPAAPLTPPGLWRVGDGEDTHAGVDGLHRGDHSGSPVSEPDHSEPRHAS
jgi:hypothetical protein